MPQIKMTVLKDEPNPYTKSLMVLGSIGPFLNGTGDVDLVCGLCGIVLLKQTAIKHFGNAVIQCGRCKAYNDMPTS